MFFSLAFSILLVLPRALAGAPGSPCACRDGGVVNVQSDCGADGSAANDTSAFQEAYNAVTNPNISCYGDRIYVPAGNWEGHWPQPMTSTVFIQGAGQVATNFLGDNTGVPIFYVKTPITLDSLGFWGSGNIGVLLDSNSYNSVLENLYCRSSSQPFVYVRNTTQDLHFENLTSISCGNASADPMVGGTMVLSGLGNNYPNNIYFVGLNIEAGNNSAIVDKYVPSVVIYGGEINNFGLPTSNPLIYSLGLSADAGSSQIYVSGAVDGTSNFYIGGTTNYDLVSYDFSSVTGAFTTFGPGPLGVAIPGSYNFTCTNCINP